MSIPAPYRFPSLPLVSDHEADSDLLVYCGHSALLAPKLDAATELSEAERAVMQRRKRAEAQAEYLLSRSQIKRMVKRHFPALSAVANGQINVLFDEDEKRLAVTHNGERVPCSVCISHSKGQVLIAMVKGIEPLGIDLERIDPARPLEKLARHFYHPEEADRIARHGAETFFRIWTLKEALAKATFRPIATLLGLNALEELEGTGLNVWSCQHLGFDITLLTRAKRPVLLELETL